MGLGKRQASHQVEVPVLLGVPGAQCHWRSWPVGSKQPLAGTKREGNATEAEQPSYVGGSWGRPGVQRSPRSLFAELEAAPSPDPPPSPRPTPTRGPPAGGETAAAQEHGTGRCVFRRVTSAFHEGGTKVENGRGRGFGLRGPVS